MKLSERTAIVTGGASGIGRAIAIEFARAGAEVAVGDVREEPKAADVPTVERVRDLGSEAIFEETDVADPDDVERLVEATVEAFDGVDILVNNAGVTTTAPLHETPREEWNRVVDINLNGVYTCTKFALPYLRDSSAGRIINVSSQRGLVGAPKKAAYCASKGGVSNLSRQMAIDYGPDGITVNAICPGPIKTSMLQSALEDPERRKQYEESTVTPFLGDPEDIGQAAVFLASDAARFVTGHNLVVDGGYTAK